LDALRDRITNVNVHGGLPTRIYVLISTSKRDEVASSMEHGERAEGRDTREGGEGAERESPERAVRTAMRKRQWQATRERVAVSQAASRRRSRRGDPRGARRARSLLEKQR
jgi:hypothetical protein